MSENTPIKFIKLRGEDNQQIRIRIDRIESYSESKKIPNVTLITLISANHYVYVKESVSKIDKLLEESH